MSHSLLPRLKRRGEEVRKKREEDVLKQGGVRQGTDTKLGLSALMKERHRRENRVGERERECPSNGYTHTHTDMHAEWERERTCPWRI